MRIALVSEHADPLGAVGGVDAGGQNVHVAALAAHLASRGHEVTVFTRRDDAAVATRLRAPDGYLVEHVPAGPPSEVPKDELWPFMADFARYLAARWAAERPDVVHAHFWMSGAAATSAAGPLDIPVVQTFHALGTVKRRYQGAHDTSPLARTSVERELCRTVDHVIATCSDEVAELRRAGLPRAKVSLVPCGVDVARFTPAPHPGDGKQRLVVVGRLVERKGVADVVDAMAELPGVELLVVGGPARDSLALDPEVQRLRRRAAAAGSLQRIEFFGRVCHDSLPAVFALADVVVAVPWYEPFGIVPLEAMACGRPVVGSAVGGLLDTILPGVTGELIPARRSDLLAITLRDLLADGRRRAAYGAAGVHRAHQHYRWEQVAAETEDVYTRVVESVSAPAAEALR